MTAGSAQWVYKNLNSNLTESENDMENRMPDAQCWEKPSWHTFTVIRIAGQESVV